MFLQRPLPKEVDVPLLIPIQRETLAVSHEMEVWRDIRDKRRIAAHANHHILPALPRRKEFGDLVTTLVPLLVVIEPLVTERTKDCYAYLLFMESGYFSHEFYHRCSQEVFFELIA